MGRRHLDELIEYYDGHDTAEEMERGRIVEPLVDPMIVVSLRLPKRTLDEVRAIAAERAVRPTALIREWVEDAISGRGSTAEAGLIRAADLLDFVRRSAKVEVTTPRCTNDEPKSSRRGASDGSHGGNDDSRRGL